VHTRKGRKLSKGGKGILRHGERVFAAGAIREILGAAGDGDTAGVVHVDIGLVAVDVAKITCCLRLLVQCSCCRISERTASTLCSIGRWEKGI
jgi:hypothetical protein